MIARINRYIPIAIEAIKVCKIAEEENGIWTVDRRFRRQISQFGGAVQIGSLFAAINFFSNENSGAKVKRPNLMKAIYYICSKDKGLEIKEINTTSLLEAVNVGNWVNGNYFSKSEILDAACAVKLALNAYMWKKEKDDPGNNNP